MAKFVSREKLGKKARKALDAQQRTTWCFSPATRKVESKKIYNRKKAQRLNRDDFSAVPSIYLCHGSKKLIDCQFEADVDFVARANFNPVN